MEQSYHVSPRKGAGWSITNKGTRKVCYISVLAQLPNNISVLSVCQISAGYGKGSHGTQVVDWYRVSSTRDNGVDTGDDPLGLRLLEHFTGKRHIRYFGR